MPCAWPPHKSERVLKVMLFRNTKKWKTKKRGSNKKHTVCFLDRKECTDLPEAGECVKSAQENVDRKWQEIVKDRH